MAEGPFDGRYRPAGDAVCGRVGEPGGALRIGGGIFTGVGMECRMDAPVPVEGMAAELYTMVCAGDDSAWSERAMIVAAADGGILMVWNGYAFKYDRCPMSPAEVAAALAGTVEPLLPSDPEGP